MELGFSVNTFFWAADQKWKSNGLRSGLCSGQGCSVLLLITRPWNLSWRKFRTSFVQFSGAPSCIHQRLERIAEKRSLGHTVSCNKDPVTEIKCPPSCRNAWTMGVFLFTTATKIITLRSFLLYVSQILRGFSSHQVPSFLRWGIWLRQKKTFRQSKQLCPQNS